MFSRGKNVLISERVGVKMVQKKFILDCIVLGSWESVDGGMSN